MSKVVWEDPPEKRNRHGIWIDRLTPVMARTNRWARIVEHPTILESQRAVSTLRSSKVKMPSGKWEFKSGTVDDKYYVYARYLGPEDG